MPVPIHPESGDRVRGLPSAAAGCLLVEGGTAVAATDGLSLRVFQIGAEELAPREHDLPAAPALLAESAAGIVAATPDGDGTALVLAGAREAPVVTTVAGTAVGLAAAGDDAYVALAHPGRADGILLRIDLSGRAVGAERALSRAAVRLTADARTGRVLVADPIAQRIDVLDRDLEPQAPDGHEGDAATFGDGDTLIVARKGTLVSVKPTGPEPGPCTLRLFWQATQLSRAGRFVLARDGTGRHAALARACDLALVAEWDFGRAAPQLLAHPSSSRLLGFRPGRGWHAIDAELYAEASGLGAATFTAPDVATFHGMHTLSLMDGHAPTKGTVKVLVLPVVEGGQTFSGGMAQLGGYLERVLTDCLRDYYVENSYGQLHDFDVTVFGSSIGAAAGAPLELPRAHLADYYWPVYVGAHVDLVKGAVAATDELLLDGRESLAIAADPLDGGRPGGTITLSTFALGFAGDHDLFPVQLRFLGTEHLRFDVRTTTGAVHGLDLQFPARTIDIDEANLAARLDELATYLDGVLADAEDAAGVIGGRVFARPKVARVKATGQQFGRLVVTVAGATATGDVLRITAVGSSGLGTDPLGIGSVRVGTVRMSQPAVLRRYLDEALLLGQDAAGFGYTGRLLNASVVAYDAPAQRLTTTLTISDRDGGPGATVKLDSASGLDALFDSAQAVDNSATTANDSMALRDRADLYRDAFSAAVQRLRDEGAAPDLLYGNHCVLVLPIEPAANVPGDPQTPNAGELWQVTPPLRPFNLRGAENMTTVADRADATVQLQSAWSLVVMAADKPDLPMILHEVGHALGFRDLYRQSGYRDELQYLEDWALMDQHFKSPHHCGFHKLQADWIPAGAGTRTDYGRVFPIGPTPPDTTETHDLLLVPVELWRDSLVQSARDAFDLDASVPVVQLVKLDLGGDAGIFDLIEARQPGVNASLALPSALPTVLVTNGISWFDDTRYAVNGWYRRELQLLNGAGPLHSPGDAFDLARAPELPAKGISVEVLDRKLVEGDANVFQIRITRQNAEFVDLYFTPGEPYYKSPDLWVDWIGDNPGAGREQAHVFPVGQPTDQGEVIRVPPSRDEPHWLIARVRNRGHVAAEDVKVTFKISDPPGAGDRGHNFRLIGSEVVPSVPGGDVPVAVMTRWMISPGFGGHSCLLVEIEDYRIPAGAAGALGGDDVWAVNNHAQKNVDRFEALKASPYEASEFEYAVHNDGVVPEVAYLEPHDLPEGMTLTVTPARQRITAGHTAVFTCRLELDESIIDVGCRNDRRFRIVTYRQDAESSVRWGGVEYEVRPRVRTETRLSGSWPIGGPVKLTGTVSPNPSGGKARIRLDYAGQQARWVTVNVGGNGVFTYSRNPPSSTTNRLEAIAWFDGSRTHGSSRSVPARLVRPVDTGPH